jgi:outer membrane scaffolding protein for murein synthesis (MipA/OmpV family)
VGVKILNDGPVRAGIGLNYAGGRTSSDDPRLKGLPDISGAAQVGGYIAYAVKPFVLELKVERRLGSTAGTQATLGASFAASPLPQLHLSVSGDVAWADASYQKTFFGITPANAALANAQGNPLPAYTPGSGLLNATLVASGVYQLSPHWGLIARLGVGDVIGNQAKDSPLTQRTFAPNIGFGALYKF